MLSKLSNFFFFFFQAEDGIRDKLVTGVQTCALPISKSGDSEKLYAHEIMTRPLHAYLVTVSACDGIGKRTYAGEGLVGLSWAFLRAGAHNVIASLWEEGPREANKAFAGISAL